ncbi:MAG: hypothetical protein KGD67_09820 [Candidatus Lokiarchaeota archaeon]|nr:hypothetical protein [Candidatus Lokiarchaeota archaeon]
MSDEFDDDYNEFLERMKEYLNINSDVFDVDFLFLPESNFDSKMNLKDENVKGFKVSYHFESGMEKPEIKIEGNFDEKKIQDYLKRLDMTKLPQFKRLTQSGKKQAIDVGTLSLQPEYSKEDILTDDLYFETNFYNDSAEIIIEAPGIEKGHILLSLSEDMRTLKVSIEINFINYEREIQLPFESKMDDHILEVNNGIVTIIMQKNKI